MESIVCVFVIIFYIHSQNGINCLCFLNCSMIHINTTFIYILCDTIHFVVYLNDEYNYVYHINKSQIVHS